MQLLRGCFFRIRATVVVATAMTIAGYHPAQAAVGQPALARIASTENRAAAVPAVGTYNPKRMSVSVMLQPQNAAEIAPRIAAMSTPGSFSYHQWLAKGEFAQRYGPSSAEVASVTAYLKANGLTVSRTASPFFLRASGAGTAVEAAFHTKLLMYRSLRNVAYFSNASAASVPASLARAMSGVVGLSNTVRLKPHYKVGFPYSARRAHAKVSAASCEAPYVTKTQLYAAVNDGTSFPFGYGAAPGCNGLTPSQTNGIYDAPNVGSRGKGAGVNIAVYELAPYQESDIRHFAKTFYGSSYHVPLVNKLVDGGPLAPVCPAGDTCFSGYDGDIEVDADIEQQIAVAPDVSHYLVYEAPNDYTGQTSLDLYSQIAIDDTADAISSSWGECENDSGYAYAQMENLVLEQLALQGQSLFVAAGDDGAFDCLGTDGTEPVNVDDPSSQPYATSVGGTSFYSFNPGENERPSYPAKGESVWNVDNLCNLSSYEGGFPGIDWCSFTGAGAGGTSEFWLKPYYQGGPGIVPGNRHVPDISANADQYTPYGEYCTANANTPGSDCGFSAQDNVPGWFGIGGTSLSSPLWSAVIADHIGYAGHRVGNINPALYDVYSIGDAYFGLHDVTGAGQLAKNNGLFATKTGYDEATGVGTPNFKAIITGSL